LREEPKHREIELSQPARFSLGAGTLIASVNVELDSIRLRDMPPGSAYEDRRKFAEQVAKDTAHKNFTEKFGPIDEDIKDDRPISYLIVHKPDAVTYEIWKQGPERRTVKL